MAHFADEDAFRFRHLLIRDTAYESLPKAERAELHRLFADWLERKVQSEPHQYEEIIGYHLERAYRYEAELGTIDPELGGRAAVHFAEAGQRANDRRDGPAAVSLLERALSLLPEGDPKRCDFLTRLGSALFETGDLSRSEALLSEAISGAQNSGDRRGEALARLHYGQVKGQTDPNWRFQDSRAEAAAAAATFEELGDHSVLSVRGTGSASSTYSGATGAPTRRSPTSAWSNMLAWPRTNARPPGFPGGSSPPLP